MAAFFYLNRVVLWVVSAPWVTVTRVVSWLFRRMGNGFRAIALLMLIGGFSLASLVPELRRSSETRRPILPGVRSNQPVRCRRSSTVRLGCRPLRVDRVDRRLAGVVRAGPVVGAEVTVGQVDLAGPVRVMRWRRGS